MAFYECQDLMPADGTVASRFPRGVFGTPRFKGSLSKDMRPHAVIKDQPHANPKHQAVANKGSLPSNSSKRETAVAANSHQKLRRDKFAV